MLGGVVESGTEHSELIKCKGIYTVTVATSIFIFHILTPNSLEHFIFSESAAWWITWPAVSRWGVLSSSDSASFVQTKFGGALLVILCMIGGLFFFDFGVLFHIRFGCCQFILPTESPVVPSPSLQIHQLMELDQGYSNYLEELNIMSWGSQACNYFIISSSLFNNVCSLSDN